MRTKRFDAGFQRLSSRTARSAPIRDRRVTQRFRRVPASLRCVRDDNWKERRDVLLLVGRAHGISLIVTWAGRETA